MDLHLHGGRVYNKSYRHHIYFSPRSCHEIMHISVSLSFVTLTLTLTLTSVLEESTGAFHRDSVALSGLQLSSLAFKLPGTYRAHRNSRF